MTLDREIALILHFLPNSIALQADCITVVEDRPIMSAKYRLPVPSSTFGQIIPTLQRSLSELLVIFVITFLTVKKFK